MIKEEAYRLSINQIKSKVKNHVDTVATLGNVCAILKERLKYFFWVGFYFKRGEALILGPFQGPPACAKLTLDKGVCAACAREKKTIIVPDVNAFPGHVACDSRSQSEIVVPVFNAGGELVAVLDVDSEKPAAFDVVDQERLEKIAALMLKIF